GFTFCKDRFSRLFSFGSKILCSSLLVALFLDIRGIFIGKTGTPSDLAFFDRGKLFPTTFVGTIGTVIQSVLLPVFSEHQDDSVALKQMVRQGIRRAMFLIVPILLILIGVGRPFIGFLLTEKWLPAVFFLNCFAITYLFHPPQYIAVEAIKAKGLSSQILYIEILRKVVEFVTLIAAIPFGCRAIALTAVLSGAVSLAIMFPFNKRYLGYTHTEQLCDIFSIVLPGCIMLACLLFCDAKIVDFPGKWVALGATGVIVYMAIMLLFRNSVANEIMQICKRYLRTRHTC
ncbi:MAG: oligosaccharide flippase family protein, partial [Victivallaceae bacterium]|nr:oligosaccharide flippase family protein [Victivallaceae bacterium]